MKLITKTRVAAALAVGAVLGGGAVVAAPTAEPASAYTMECARVYRTVYLAGGPITQTWCTYRNISFAEWAAGFREGWHWEWGYRDIYGNKIRNLK